MTRKSTWANSDGLVVGFGPSYPERETAGDVETDGAVKEARLYFTYQSSAPTVSLPAGAVVRSVTLKVGSAWVGGTSIAFGDGGDTGGFITATQGATANLTAGAVIVGGGAYMVGGTDATAKHLDKVYAAADTIDLTVVGTFTAGDGTLIVEYL